MAKGQYEEWLTKDALMLLHGWKMAGLTDVDVAKKIGINPRTLEKWKAQHGQIGQALKRGKEGANYIIENALFNKALQGNTTAMIFWLKNNYREKYTDDVNDPALRQAQIRKAKAEADIMEAKAKREMSENGTDSVNVNIVMPNSNEEENDNE